jgi:hypothetical protein
MGARLTEKREKGKVTSDMSYNFMPMKNKHQKLTTTKFQQYMDNSDEPRDNVFRDTHQSLEIELLEDSLPMRQQFRHTAQRLRNQA